MIMMMSKTKTAKTPYVWDCSFFKQEDMVKGALSGLHLVLTTAAPPRPNNYTYRV